MNKNILIIGSNSFSGASFASYALKQHYNVVGISRSPEPHSSLLPYKWGNTDNFVFHQLDLNNDLDKIMSLIDGEKPELVFNFASQSMVAQSWDYPEHWFMTNLVSTVKFHDQLRKKNFLQKYVHITTPEVYGSCSDFIKENTPYNPSTPYAVSRAACDMSLKTFFDNYQFPVVSTRAANVYGPGQQLYRIIPRTILYIRLGEKLQLHGGGISERSFIHINDVSEATLNIAMNGIPGETYHISTNRMISIRALVELICQKMGVDFDEYVDVADERPGKDAAYMLDSSKLRNTLSWEDKTELEQGIEETINWVDSHFNDLKQQPYDYIHKP